MSNSGAITTLTNSGGISGGAGGFSPRFIGGRGGTGVSNGGTVTTLTNSGAISGGGGGDGGFGAYAWPAPAARVCRTLAR